MKVKFNGKDVNNPGTQLLIALAALLLTPVIILVTMVAIIIGIFALIFIVPFYFIYEELKKR